MLTAPQLKSIMPTLPAAKRKLYLPHLNAALLEHEIDTHLRVCHFLAQLAHESAELKYFQEIASGKAYEGRKDLGNTQPGDGVKFKGHGPIQITGRANHAACGKALGLDLISDPLLITRPKHAFRSAGWYWSSRGLNKLADQNNIRAITKKINGGYNGLEDRKKYLQRALQVIPRDFNLYGLRDAGEMSLGAAAADSGEIGMASEGQAGDHSAQQLNVAPDPAPQPSETKIAALPDTQPANEDADDTIKIPAIPPLPVKLPAAVKGMLGGTGGLVGLLAAVATYFQTNPQMLALALNALKWTAIGFAQVASVALIGLFAQRMWNAKLANDLNIVRFHNHSDEATRNVDFKGWKETEAKAG